MVFLRLEVASLTFMLILPVLLLHASAVWHLVMSLFSWSSLSQSSVLNRLVLLRIIVFVAFRVYRVVIWIFVRIRVLANLLLLTLILE